MAANRKCYECISNGQNYSTICRPTGYLEFFNIHLGQLLGGGNNF